MATSGSISTEFIATVTVGSLSDNWNITTKAGQTRIFITSNNYSGNIGGLAGADATCQSEAGVLGYSGFWKALVSSNSINAKDRVVIAYPVVRASNEAIVVDSLNLWDSNLENPVSTSNVEVHTGTSANGNKSVTCGSWTIGISSERDYRGLANSTSNTWMSYSNGGYCSKAARLYCVDQ